MKKRKKVTFAGFDGNKYTVTPAKGAARQFAAGKCFAFYCRNAILYVRMSKNGIAHTGYCAHFSNDIAHDRGLATEMRGHGEWFVLLLGKIKPAVPRRKSLSCGARKRGKAAR